MQSPEVHTQAHTFKAHGAGLCVLAEARSVDLKARCLCRSSPAWIPPGRSVKHRMCCIVHAVEGFKVPPTGW